MTSAPAADAVTAVFREQSGRVLATLIRLLGDFELAEEARQEAFVAALEQWPKAGVPGNPGAWLIQVGRHKAIDVVRRRTLAREHVVDLETTEAALAASVAGIEDSFDEAEFGDDRLRLIFTCCHPAIALESQVALTLRTVCGIPTDAVARAFLVAEDTMAQRLVRAQRKIRDAGIPYETPSQEQLDERIDGVLAVIYLVFTEGYAVTRGPEVVRADLCEEAIRLVRLLDMLLPGRGAILGLLALMRLHHARHRARADEAGDLVLLEDQDRSLWDGAAIDEGLSLVERALRIPGRVSPYAVQAAIAALHARATTPAATDWPQIVGLYEVLMRLQPSPVIELNHAAAVSMVDGPARALDLVDSLAARGGVAHSHLLAAVRGHLLQRLERREEALAAYRTALDAVRVGPEQRHLERRIAALRPSSE